MTHFTIVTDLNRCVGCMSCNTACKTINEVEIGNYRTRVLRMGPFPRFEGANFPDVDWYYLPMQCQNCAAAPCVDVCPTGATFYDENGVVQIEAENCIGCQSCMSACPYGARYLKEADSVVDKCSLCADLVAEGGMPQCVKECVGLAKWYGDIDADPSMMSFVGGYEKTMGEVVAPFEDGDIYHLPDVGNAPTAAYILRGKEWQMDKDFTVTQGGRGFGLPNEAL